MKATDDLTWPDHLPPAHTLTHPPALPPKRDKLSLLKQRWGACGIYMNTEFYMGK